MQQAGRNRTVSDKHGGHTLSFKAADKAGNVTMPVSIDITTQNQVDTTLPILTLSTLEDGAITNNDTLNIGAQRATRTASRALS